MRRRFLAFVTIAGASLATFGAADAGAHITQFARLSGAEQVPGPGDPDASAAALIDLKPPTQQVCGAVRHTRLDPVSAFHIHGGAAGTAGPPVVDLSPTLGGQPCVTAPLETIRAIRRNPSSFYVDLHTAGFPDGAIRGQIDQSQDESTTPRTTGPGHLFGSMSGELEVPGPGDPDGRGVVFVDIRPAVGKACADERYAGLDTPTEIHIHRGAAGDAGGVVIDLTPALSGTRCVSAPAEKLLKISNHPGRYYCNLHTVAIPRGAIRGQLAPSS